MDDVVAALDNIGGRFEGHTPPRMAGLPPMSSSGSSIAPGRPDQKTLVTSVSLTKPLSVLIVEPSRMQAGIVRKYLESAGVAVAGAVKTGAETIASIRSNVPNAIVSALHLDDMTGIELAKQVRADLKNQAPGFVLISSEAAQSESESLSQIDRTVLLAKPFTAEQLQDAISVVTAKTAAIASTDFSIASEKSLDAQGVGRRR